MLGVFSVLALMSSKEHLMTLRHGTNQLQGVVRKKWSVKREEVDLEFSHIRVGALPFEISEKDFEQLSEGDAVLVSSTPRDRKVVSTKKTGLHS